MAVPGLAEWKVVSVARVLWRGLRKTMRHAILTGDPGSLGARDLAKWSAFQARPPTSQFTYKAQRRVDARRPRTSYRLPSGNAGGKTRVPEHLNVTLRGGCRPRTSAVQQPAKHAVNIPTVARPPTAFYEPNLRSGLTDPGSELDRWAGRELLETYFRSFEEDARRFASTGVFAHVKLREAIEATVNNPLLQDGSIARSWVRPAVCLEVLRRLSASAPFRQYGPLLRTLHVELARALYSDAWSPDMFPDDRVATLDELCEAKPFFSVVREQERALNFERCALSAAKARIQELETQLQAQEYKRRQNEKLLQVAAEKLHGERAKKSFGLWRDWVDTRVSIKNHLREFVNRSNGMLTASAYDQWTVYTSERRKEREMRNKLLKLSKRALLTTIG